MSRNYPQTAWRPICPDRDSGRVPRCRSAPKLRQGRVDETKASEATQVPMLTACRRCPSNRARHVDRMPTLPTLNPRLVRVQERQKGGEALEHIRRWTPQTTGEFPHCQAAMHESANGGRNADVRGYLRFCLVRPHPVPPGRAAGTLAANRRRSVHGRLAEYLAAASTQASNTS